MPMRILVIGRSGQLATELRRLAWPDAAAVVACGREAIDVRDRDLVRDSIASTRPDVVINTAAYTAVDRAEAEFRGGVRR